MFIKNDFSEIALNCRKLSINVGFNVNILLEKLIIIAIFEMRGNILSMILRTKRCNFFLGQSL